MGGVILAVGVAGAWCAVALRLGPRLGYVDRPDDAALKAHLRPAVPLGGVGVFLGLHAGLALESAFDWGLFVASLCALTLGLIDDRFGVAPTLRLAAEFGIGVVLVVATDTTFTSPLAMAVGVLTVVVLINAVNLFDGLDGLAGSAALVTGLGLAWLAALRGVDGVIPLLLAAALAGFLPFNWHPARLFLGDNGAYTIGTVLAFATVIVSPDGLGVGWLIALVPLGVFLVDFVATILRRLLAGKALFTGDRSHLYDQLRDRGVPVKTVALTAVAAQALFAVLAAALDGLSSSGLAAGALFGVAALILILLWWGGFLTDRATT